MTTASTVHPGDQELRTSDPRLPLIVSQAAIEFDNAIQGAPTDFSAAKRLAEFLRVALDASPDAPANQQKNIDATAIGIVGQALPETGTAVETVADVLAKALEIAGGLENPQNGDTRPSLAFLRDFCVAFGNRLLAHREAMRNYSPSNPYRR